MARRTKHTSEGGIRFLYRTKHNGTTGVSFMHLAAFLDWLKGRRVVIEADGDVPLIKDL